jgi:hypothetical protein
MKNWTLFLFCILALHACTSSADDQESASKTSTETPAETPVIASKQCFADSLQDGSVVSVTVEESDGKVKGTLSYLFAQKDSGSGEYQGVREGDHYRVVWSYTIEGSAQKEEVVFKIEGDQWIRKNGELLEKDGILILKDEANTPYDELLRKVSCEL